MQWSKSVVVPSRSCCSARHCASGLLPPDILAPASPRACVPWLLSSPTPAPSLPQGPLQPWAHPCPYHLSPKSVTAPQTSSTSPCLQHHPTLALGPSHSPPKHSEPPCRAGSPGRSLCPAQPFPEPCPPSRWGFRLGTARRHTHVRAHRCVMQALARRSEQLASIPADYVGAGNAGDRKACESGSERCQIRCPCTAGCFRFRDMSLPRSLSCPGGRQQGLRSSAKASSQPRWPRERL